MRDTVETTRCASIGCTAIVPRLVGKLSWCTAHNLPLPPDRENQNLAVGGVKFDLGKTRLDLIAPEFLEGLGQILTHGAQKYSDHNWAKGMHWSRAYGAVLRHLNAWNGGEDLDKESGKPHLWHAAAELMFLVGFEARGTGTDDRYKEPK